MHYLNHFFIVLTNVHFESERVLDSGMGKMNVALKMFLEWYSDRSCNDSYIFLVLILMCSIVPKILSGFKITYTHNLYVCVY